MISRGWLEKIHKDENNRKYFIFFEVLFIVCVILLCSKFIINKYNDNLKEIVNKDNYKYTEGSTEGNSNMGELLEGTYISQSIIPEYNLLSSIDIMFGTYGRKNEGETIVKLIETKSNSVIESWSVKNTSLGDNTYKSFKLSKELVNTQGNEYNIVLTAAGVSGRNAVTVWKTSYDSYKQGSIYINNVKQTGDISFKLSYEKIESYRNLLTTYFWWGAVAIILFFGVMFSVLLFKKNIKIENIFLGCILFWGIIYMFVLPPLSAPDETVHFQSAYKLSSKILMKPVMKNEMIALRAGDEVFCFENQPSIKTYMKVYNGLLKTNNSKGIVGIVDKSLTLYSIQYLPQAIGISIARLFNFSSVGLVYMGRFFNLLFFSILVFYAIKKIPFGKVAIIAIALLPMMLELTSSYSYDAVINALTILFVSYCLYVAYEKKKITIKDGIILLVVFLLIVPCKWIYSTVGLLVFILPIWKERLNISRKTKILIAIVFAVIGISILVAAKQYLVSTSTGKYMYIEWAKEEGYSIYIFAKNPLLFLNIITNTYIVNWSYYLDSMIGRYLGWLEIFIDKKYILLFEGLLIVAALNSYNQKIVIHKWHRLLFIGIAFISISGSIISMLLFITPLSWNLAAGVQGRYFLPVLLPVMLAGCFKIFSKYNLERVVVGLGCVLQLLVINSIFITIASRF